MMNTGAFQRDIIIQSQSADVVNCLYQRGLGLLVLVVQGVYYGIQIMFMIGRQKRGQQGEGPMVGFCETFPLAFKTYDWKIGITNMIKKDLASIIISNSSGAIAAPAQRTTSEKIR